MNNPIKYIKNKIIINNNLNIKFHDVRIKLRATDDWIDLGEIVQGINQYQVNDEPTELDRGILQVRQPNGQYFNAGFKKDTTESISLGLMLSDDLLEYIRESKEDCLNNSIGCQLINHSITDLKEKVCLFTPVSEKNARSSYSASLKSVTMAGGGIRCEVDVPGGLTYIGVGGGWGIGTSWGTATLSKSFHELRRPGNNINKDHSKGWIGGWEYIPVIFYFRFNAPHLTMNSGGFGGLGYSGGSGYYVAQYL